jgi:phytoene desaturase
MNKTRVAVIGSGFGGLAAAIRLQTAGFQVDIFEKRDQPGGRAYVFRDNGFVFDAGPTVITAPQCLRDLFEGAGRRMNDYIELIPVNPFYRLFWHDGTVFDYSNDETMLFDQIRRLSPGDEEGYRRFLAYSKEVYREGYERLAHVPFLNWMSMVKVAPQLIRLSAHRSVFKTVAGFVKEPHLREAFSFHSLLVGGNPFQTSSIYTLIHYLERSGGVHFPRGGTGALIQALVRLFEELGGKLHLNRGVERVVTHEGRVTALRDVRGDVTPFDAVVSNADVVHTYRHLLKDEPRAAKKGRALAKKRHSMSLFLIYFGTKKKFPALAHHNVIFGPRYEELLKDIFDRGVLAEDFSLYLHAPTVTDPSLAPAGCEGFYVLSPVPHLGKANLDWSVEGPRYAERILNALDQRLLPGLRENLVTQRIFTPADFKNELNAHWGSAFSLEPLLTQSAFFRVHNRDEKIPNLYFVGAGTHPGAGVPGVVGSARATAELMIGDLLAGPGRTAALAATRAASAPESAVAHCREMITKGSKSFSWASRLFGNETRDAAFSLYGWCRYCDDQIDGGELGFSPRATGAAAPISISICRNMTWRSR